MKIGRVMTFITLETGEFSRFRPTLERRDLIVDCPELCYDDRCWPAILLTTRGCDAVLMLTVNLK
jgi:hypothetical protein